MSLRGSHLERILGKVEDLDSLNLSILIQRLARERQLLETVFNIIQEGILVVNCNGLIEYANSAAHRLLGIAEDNVGNVEIWKFIPDLARWLNFPKQGGQVKPAVVSREVEITYPEHRHLRLYSVPIESPEDASLEDCFALILSDTTEDRLSTEERIESERFSSIFMLAAGVAHEIGNPLNSMNIHLQLMARELKKLEPSSAVKNLMDSVDVCSSEIQRLDGIISHFLEALRPRPPDFTDVQLISILEDVLTFHDQELKNLGIQVDVELKEVLPVILADYNQIKEVFFNVLKNSMEAMDQGGRIKISAYCDDAYIYIQMADTGVGIEQDELSKIFQPFYTTKKEGHGLGMLLVQRILREHGGQMGIDSQPGMGTVVTLQFPQKHRRVRMLEDRSQPLE
tara:strand:+ start:304 stop:1497 length:1194 start_codon:yes stop_codon:yes gene_type:complete